MPKSARYVWTLLLLWGETFGRKHSGVASITVGGDDGLGEFLILHSYTGSFGLPAGSISN
jgi:hypothetical protein